MNENPRQLRNYHQFKTRNWWCQCILANIDKIIVGLRTERGIVNNLEEIKVSDLPVLGEVSVFIILVNFINFCCSWTYHKSSIKQRHWVVLF